MEILKKERFFLCINFKHEKFGANAKYFSSIKLSRLSPGLMSCDNKKEQVDINIRGDNQQQYGRLYILEFLHFGYNVHPNKENCALKILFNDSAVSNVYQ